MVFVDSTVPQTSPLKSGMTPFSEEEDDKATMPGIAERNSVVEKNSLTNRNTTHENDKSKNDSKT